MHKLEYRWTRAPRGQFVDGHGRADVVDYRNKVFLPTIEVLDPRIRQWTKEGTEVPVGVWEPRLTGRRVVLWYHDESTFYAHDRREERWVAKGETSVPRKKGEGASLMVADFVSADHGWLCSPDGKESARVLFKAGKNREGYFTNEEILDQVSKAMDILQRHFSHEEHVLIYDNAPTHLKRASDALSARHMSLKPTSKEDYWFGVEVNVTDDLTGKPVYGRDGKLLKKKIPMTGQGSLMDPRSHCTSRRAIRVQESSRAWLFCCRSAESTSQASEHSAPTSNVHHLPWTAAAVGCYTTSRTFVTSRAFWRRNARRADARCFSCRNFTVS